MIKVHDNLKPLSANLKRIEIGSSLIDEEFGYLIEENLLDEFWTSCIYEWGKSNRLSLFGPHYYKYTESFIIAIDLAYQHYLQNPENSKPKLVFNKLLKLGIIYYIENDKSNKDFNKILDVIKTLNIIETETIDSIKEAISRNKTNIIPEKKSDLSPMNTIKKYQIFISSTYIDLVEERQAAVEAILQKGHIPAGMELFSANDKSQWEVIEKWIDDSDIYILLLGGRYGSINDETGLSYTQMEYNYAVSKGKPLFTLILGDEILDGKPREITKDYDLKDEKYKAFKKDVSSKMCSFPKNIDQIKLNINQSLDGIINEYKDSLTGWIKGCSLR